MAKKKEAVRPAVAACGCGVGGGRKGTSAQVDPEVRERHLKRLRRIEGQVRGVHKMIEEARRCPEVMTQLSSVQEALRSVGRELMRHHLRHCAATARGGEVYDEVVDLMYKQVR